ncbi:MAG: hypothetical protein QOG57_6046, partial [Pseudonocardiales bacterium]|nr:hypothetical protein [Pseudonocardiales bacterium]
MARQDRSSEARWYSMPGRVRSSGSPALGWVKLCAARDVGAVLGPGGGQSRVEADDRLEVGPGPGQFEHQCAAEAVADRGAPGSALFRSRRSLVG